MAEAPARWGFATLRGWRPSWLPGDALAALTLAAIAIPEQLATARLLGMPPVTGLFTFAAGAVAFAVFGRNRFLSAGADSTIAPIMAASLASLAVAGTAPYAGLAAVLALMVGAVLMLSLPLRLGWIADLLSIPVATGFLAGISVHIAVGQLPTILGIASPGIASMGGSLPGQMLDIARHLGKAMPWPVGIAGAVLGLSLLAERIDRRIPGPLIGLVASGLLVWHFGLVGQVGAAHGVAVLGALPVAAPAMALFLPDWSQLARLLPLSLIVALVCMMQSAVVEQSYPSNNAVGGQRVDMARDFAAIGLGSVLAALLGGFAVNASPPRTAVVANSGGRSQLAGLLAVLCVAALVLPGAGLFAYVPHAALGGVLLVVALRIFRLETMRQVFRRAPGEILLVVASACLVVTLPIETGVAMSIVLSLLHSIFIVARPPCAVLARVPGTTIWWNLAAGEAGEHEPGVLVFAAGAPVTFVNADFLLGRLVAAVGTVPGCRLVVIEANGVIDVDFTGSLMLQQAIRDLRARGIGFAVARLESPRARAAALRTGLLDAIGAGREFRSVEEAIRACRADPTPSAPCAGA